VPARRRQSRFARRWLRYVALHLHCVPETFSRRALLLLLSFLSECAQLSDVNIPVDEERRKDCNRKTNARWSGKNNRRGGTHSDRGGRVETTESKQRANQELGRKFADVGRSRFGAVRCLQRPPFLTLPIFARSLPSRFNLLRSSLFSRDQFNQHGSH